MPPCLETVIGCTHQQLDCSRGTPGFTPLAEGKPSVVGHGGGEGVPAPWPFVDQRVACGDQAVPDQRQQLTILLRALARRLGVRPRHAHQAANDIDRVGVLKRYRQTFEFAVQVFRQIERLLLGIHASDVLDCDDLDLVIDAVEHTPRADAGASVLRSHRD